MEVRLSRSFAERIRAVDPEHADVCNAALPVMLVSPKGAVVEKTAADSWAKGTFTNVVDSLDHHFDKHGRGRTRQQYTLDALRFFSEYKEQAQWGKWNPAWSEAFRLRIGGRGGYFTPGGRVLAYWDAHGKCEAAV